MRISKKIQLGFTVVELLVVMIVITTVGLIIVGIFFSSLRTTKKTNSLDDVRRSGNYALQQMGRSIQYARVFGGVSTKDDITFNFVDFQRSCITSTITPTPTISQYSYVGVKGFDGGKTIFQCDPQIGIASKSAGPDQAHPNIISLIDTSKFSVSACTITCQQDGLASPPTITISFTLSNNSTGFNETKATLPFQTSVTLRNY